MGQLVLDVGTLGDLLCVPRNNQAPALKFSGMGVCRMSGLRFYRVKKNEGER